MNNFFRALIAGYGAKKLGGGCLGTIIVFVLIWVALGQCSGVSRSKPVPQSYPTTRIASLMAFETQNMNEDNGFFLIFHVMQPTGYRTHDRLYPGKLQKEEKDRTNCNDDSDRDAVDNLCGENGSADKIQVNALPFIFTRPMESSPSIQNYL